MDVEFSADAVAHARDAVKAHLRMVGDQENEIVAGHAASALALCEAFIGRAVFEREQVAIVPADGRWQRLASAPVTAITQVAGVDASGAAVALDANEFGVDIDARGEGWVRLARSGLRQARVTFAAGIAPDWAALPAPLAQGVILLAAHLSSGATTGPPAAVTALWRPWRRMRLKGGGDARI